MTDIRNYTVNSRDNLWKIVKREYGAVCGKLTNGQIASIVNSIIEENKKEGNFSANSLSVGQLIKLPNILELNGVSIFSNCNEEKLTSSAKEGYFRANDLFGDVGSEKYKQQSVPSMIFEKTIATVGVIEDVVIDICGRYNSLTSRDAKMCDIFAKEVGKWNKDGNQASGGFAFEQTDAYKFALTQNSDDYTIRESEYKGKKETHAYLDPSKSDGKITLFSKELINNNEYLTMRDKDNKVHYFDVANNLSEVQIRNEN